MNIITVEFKDKKALIVNIAEHGYTLREFSRKIGVSQGYLSQLLNDEKNPSPVVANKLAKGLGLNMNDLFLIKVIDKSITRK